MSRVELPDGQWAELRDPKKVTERKRRAYIAQMSEFNRSRVLAGPDGFGAEQEQLWDTALDLLIEMLVAAWSFDQPVTVEALSDFGVDVFDPLKAACLALARDVLPEVMRVPAEPTEVAAESAVG